MAKLSSLLLWITYAAVASAVSITDIQGIAWQSPFVGQTVSNLTGIVTAKGSSGFYLVGEKTDDIRASNGLFVFSSSTTVLNKVAVGNLISLTAKVQEFRSSTAPNDLTGTELASPTNIVVLSTNNTITPVILGKDRSPPTQLFSALDVGPDGFLSVPNNSSQIDTVNAPLQPDLYGMDFWASLEGQLVTIPKPVGTAFPNSFGEIWVYGDWETTGKNSRGGLTMTFGPDGIPDGNPETVIIGAPLDGTKNPATAVGTGFSDITGVVLFQFGFYYVLPTTAPTVISVPDPVIPPSSIVPDLSDACSITFGDYNVENLSPNVAHLPTVATHIASFLNMPDLMFVQEIQDNNGATDNGVVDANVTLTTLVNAIAKVSNITYQFTSINPVDDQDGGEPGGNIRTAYLYRPDRLKLFPGSPVGGSLDAVNATATPSRKPHLNFNPGRIDPTSDFWNVSRKPLVAHWETPSGQDFFTINVHLESKGGSSSTQGNARPPVNLPVEKRTGQVATVADFVKSLLDLNPSANIVMAGDFNEFVETRSVLAPIVPFLQDIDDVAGIPVVERYTYVFDQNSEQLDHVFVSSAIASRGVEFEHVHVNNWSPKLSVRASDHDPSVGKVHIC
ncbi:DNase I-like protein [Pholiota conissans]|uniref:DNase I-like protein n=1 Tax=Pholiota conissans TaxID=109636 RepID=A0A9P5Z2X5_9AGAR|nr:DNase I-like protein [Pholiota conissans]